MTYEERVNELKRMLRPCPDILTPLKTCKWSPLGRNRIYELIKTGEIRSFIYQNSYITTKGDLIEYLALHATDEEKNTIKFKRGRLMTEESKLILKQQSVTAAYKILL